MIPPRKYNFTGGKAPSLPQEGERRGGFGWLGLGLGLGLGGRKDRLRAPATPCQSAIGSFKLGRGRPAHPHGGGDMGQRPYDSAFLGYGVLCGLVVWGVLGVRRLFVLRGISRRRHSWRTSSIPFFVWGKETTAAAQRSHRHKSRNKGGTSTDRSTKATLMLTVPRSITKSSTEDLTRPTF